MLLTHLTNSLQKGEGDLDVFDQDSDSLIKRKFIDSFDKKQDKKPLKSLASLGQGIYRRTDHPGTHTRQFAYTSIRLRALTPSIRQRPIPSATFFPS